MDFDDAIEFERRLHPGETDKQLSERIVAESLPDVVREMATLAHFAENPVVRAEALEFMRADDRKWQSFFVGYEFARQKANERDFGIRWLEE